MRIGFCGAAGTGKTTLLNKMVKRYNFLPIQEGVRLYLKMNGFKSVEELDSPGKVKKMQNTILDWKIDRETSTKQNFIADRTSIDNIVYAIKHLSNDEESGKWLDKYIEKGYNHAKNYNLIVVFPMNKIPYELDGVRVSNKYEEYSFQLMLEGMLARLNQESKTHIHFLKAVDLEERVEEVATLIDDIQNYWVIKSKKGVFWD